MGKKSKGFESESGLESEIFWIRTRESFLKKPKGFESFESESRIRSFTIYYMTHWDAKEKKGFSNVTLSNPVFPDSRVIEE